MWAHLFLIGPVYFRRKGELRLDVPSVDLVVNYDIPRNSKDYIHRVGRTARAGRAGRALTLVSQYDIELFQRIEHFLEKKLEEFTDLKDALVKADPPSRSLDFSHYTHWSFEIKFEIKVLIRIRFGTFIRD